MLGHVGSVRASRIPHSARWAADVHTFWPVTTHSSPSRTARVAIAGQVGPGLGLGEELAPHLVAPEHRGRTALLLVGAVGEIVGPTMPMAMANTPFDTPKRPAPG